VAHETPPDPDVIAPRRGEELDAGVVGRYLAGKLPGAEGMPEIWQFPGGHANLTYLVRYPTARYVLRRGPHGDVAAGAHDMGREYRVLSVLYQKFSLAPRAFVYCEDKSVIGAVFFVMERRDGIVVRRDVPPEFGGGADPAQTRKLSQVIIDTLADFHAVDPEAAGLMGLGKPEGYLQRQVKGWSDRWNRAKTKEIQPRTRSWRGSRATRRRPRRRRWSTTTGASTTWRSPPAILAAASRSTTGTCAPSATRSPISARSSRRGTSRASRTSSSRPCPRARRAS